MITAGVGPAVVALHVLGVVGWLGANGGHGFDCCSLWAVVPPGAAGAGAAGSTPVRD